MRGLRSLLYRLARFLGDLYAVRRGRIGQRLHNRILGKGIGRFAGRLWR